jgi:hypothetical protein
MLLLILTVLLSEFTKDLYVSADNDCWSAKDVSFLNGWYKAQTVCENTSTGYYKFSSWDKRHFILDILDNSGNAHNVGNLFNVDPVTSTIKTAIWGSNCQGNLTSGWDTSTGQNSVLIRLVNCLPCADVTLECVGGMCSSGMYSLDANATSANFTFLGKREYIANNRAVRKFKKIRHRKKSFKTVPKTYNNETAEGAVMTKCSKPHMSVLSGLDLVNGYFWVSAYGDSNCNLFNGSNYFMAVPTDNSTLTFDMDNKDDSKTWNNTGIILYANSTSGQLSNDFAEGYLSAVDDRLSLTIKSGSCIYKSTCITGACSLFRWVNGYSYPQGSPGYPTPTMDYSPPSSTFAGNGNGGPPFYIAPGWSCYPTTSVNYNKTEPDGNSGHSVCQPSKDVSILNGLYTEYKSSCNYSVPKQYRFTSWDSTHFILDVINSTGNPSSTGYLYR